MCVCVCQKLHANHRKKKKHADFRLVEKGLESEKKGGTGEENKKNKVICELLFLFCRVFQGPCCSYCISIFRSRA